MKRSGTLGALGVAALAVFCCAGLPLLVALGASVGAAAVLGGIGAALGAAALAVGVLLLVRRGRVARARRRGSRSGRTILFGSRR